MLRDAPQYLSGQLSVRTHNAPLSSCLLALRK
uniref:Uncharacterized protein n=1 Tax=Anguilla anguilla TaxID=7936 RepID=A0A0E9SU24_ANGAN